MFEGMFPLPLLKNKPLIVPFEPDVEIEPVTPKEPVIRVDPVIWTVCWSGFTNEAVEAKLELIAFCTNEAVEAKLELKAYEELATNEAVEAKLELTARDALTANEAVEAKLELIAFCTNEAVWAFEALKAYEELATKDAVEAKLELKAYEELATNEAVEANEDVLENEAVEAKLELKAYEELTEKDEVVENDAVPNKEPVIIAVLPDTFIASALNVPNLTESSDETCSIGKPDISFTENKDPESKSVTENSCPWDPWISRIVDPDPLMIRPFFILNSFAIIYLPFIFPGCTLINMWNISL